MYQKLGFANEYGQRLRARALSCYGAPLEHCEIWEFGAISQDATAIHCAHSQPHGVDFPTNSKVCLAPILVTRRIATAIADLSHMPKLSVSGFRV